jgi:hypothetical protein
VAQGASPSELTILRTTSGGPISGPSGWTVQTYPVPNGNVYTLQGVTCLTTQICFAVGGRFGGPSGVPIPGLIYRTMDGGATPWKPIRP